MNHFNARDAEFTRTRRKRNSPGSACVSRAGERVLAIANFSYAFHRSLRREHQKKRLFRRDAETNTRDACATQKAALQQLEPREVLRINDPNRHIVVIDHDQIVDPMAFEQVQNFDREFVFVHSDRI